MKTPFILLWRVTQQAIVLSGTAMFLHCASRANSDDARPQVVSKLLKNQLTFVTAHERTDGKLGLLVAIVIGREQASILYSDLRVQAFDDSGEEIPVSPFLPNGLKISDIQMFSEVSTGSGGECVGHYVVGLRKGQHATAIQITRDGETQKFPIQIVKAVKEPPKIGP